LTASGLDVLDNRGVARAQLMIRVERACDLRLTVELASPAVLGVALNDFAAPQCEAARQVSLVVPGRSVRAGINLLTFGLGVAKPGADQAQGQDDTKPAVPELVSLVIEPLCETAR
jgi:hypothetical protein